ncbi:hypothetical protein VU04_01115, partial [Desulfobulbus sp. TB]|nr:hypothetical protein [Desulfobulbus sp. TB]
MSSPKQQLPGFWHFCWMFWMQPILLYQRLRACGVDDPNARPWKQWFAEEGQRAKRCYLRYQMLQLMVLMPLVVLSGAAILLYAAQFLGLPVDISALFLKVAYGVAVGVAVGVAYGVAVGVAFGVAVGVAYGVA